MSKLTWLVTCMTERELLYLKWDPWLSDKDRQTMNLRKIVAREIENFRDLEGKVSFEIIPVKHTCWHFLKSIRCVEVSAIHIADRNDTEVDVHTYMAIVCPNCLKEHRKVIKVNNIVRKKIGNS